MLGKLIKHELKATSRIFILLYGILICVGIGNTIILNLLTLALEINSDNIFPPMILIFMVFGFFALIIATMILTWVLIIQRFYRSCYGAQGYLTHTLPVHPWEILVSKLTAAMIWVSASGGLVLLCILVPVFVAFSSYTLINMGDLHYIWEELFYYYDISLLFPWILASLFASASSILMIYASISMSSLINGHKLLVSVGAYMVFNIVFTFVEIMLTYSSVFLMATSWDFYDTNINFYSQSLWITFGISAIKCAIFFFITHYVMDKNIKELIKGNIKFILLFLLMIVVFVVVGIKIQKIKYADPPLQCIQHPINQSYLI